MIRPGDGPQLLAGWLSTGQPESLTGHAARHGPLPANAGLWIRQAVSAAGLRGRGGAWFSTGRKLGTVATNGAKAGAAYVVVNGAESEPAAAKDKLLLQVAPHLVLDGAELAAVAVGAREVTVCLHRGAGIVNGLRAGVTVRAVESPRWYVSSDSTALAQFVGGGPGKPRSVSAYQQGVNHKPTLVSNTETFAHVALIARYGAGWFRRAGTDETPGTWLITLSGAVARPGVYEAPVGVSLSDLLRHAGGVTEPWLALLMGGYGGAWRSPKDLMDCPLAPEVLKSRKASLGAGILVGLPQSACGLAETVRVVSWLASQNARQCGPCFMGTPAIADDLARLTWDRDSLAWDRVKSRMATIKRRGECSHPDGIVSLASSAVDLFANDISVHLVNGGCPGSSRAPLLPLPEPLPANEPWR
jgi:NADH:ubiquinone oxidoreductase subunit F (NADH-binding)